MMAAKKEWISGERRTAMVDILLKAKADLKTQENVRLQCQNMYSIVHATPYLYIIYTQLLCHSIFHHRALAGQH